MFDKITLEVSLKPFKKVDDEHIHNVCKEIFLQWRPLLKGRKEISIMFWASDGSEILDYDGDLSKSFEWAYFNGTANLPEATDEDNENAVGLHNKKRKYIKNPPIMTYNILKNIATAFKEEGKKLYPNTPILIGDTFDIGPEFAISDFKYNRHREITSGSVLDTFGFIDSTALLNADNRPYAAYPNGIPQNTPFATFLGKQTKAFFADLGFDFIWLSNGLGFSSNPWDLTGKIYDGEKFYPEKLDSTSKKVFDFWKLFREACPDIPIHTRGTNNSAGIDYATDGVPLYDIYKSNFNILPPPNSPWAPLNGDYGLELMGHMTRICELPGNEFLFRFYIHDPWWRNSPWYDRYDSCAHDIYLPMSISRVTENGTIQTANRFYILSIDNSDGNMPDSCVNEPIPHILKAEKNAPDEMPFLLWLYPLKEYTRAKTANELSEMYKADVFISNAINNGFPLNCVISTDVFNNIDIDKLQGKILVSPIIKEPKTLSQLSNFISLGGKIILYGTQKELNDFALKNENIKTVCVEDGPSSILEQLSTLGYQIKFNFRKDVIKLPVWNMSRSNNGNFFSVYNPDTTTDLLMRFPLGAPVLLGCETEIVNGFAKFRFSRCEHKECRIFVNQADGVISTCEETPVSFKYRRRIKVSGLKNATVYYFPEEYCKEHIAVTDIHPDFTPKLLDGWVPIHDDVFGSGFKGENITGTISFLMPKKQL